MSQFQIDEMAKMTKAKLGQKDMELVTEKAPKTYEMKPSEVLVQCLYRPQEMIHPQIISSSYNWVDQGMGWQRVMDPFGGWVHISRNWMTQMFLKRKEFKYLLMIDSDEAVPWYIPFHMAEAMDREDLQVLSGVVCGFTLERGLFACVAVKGPDGKARFPSVRDTRSIPREGIQEVHNAGTGCIMMRRDLIEAMWLRYTKDKSFGQPFGIPEAEQNLAALQGALPRGEDVCFTDRVREMGSTVYVDWACKIGHQKPFMLVWPDNKVVSISPDKWAAMAWPHVKKGSLKTPGKAKKSRKRRRG